MTLAKTTKKNKLLLNISPAIEQHVVTELFVLNRHRIREMMPIYKYEAKKWVAPGDMPKPRIKPDLHPRMTMICVWWDWESIVHWEML